MFGFFLLLQSFLKDPQIYQLKDYKMQFFIEGRIIYMFFAPNMSVLVI